MKTDQASTLRLLCYVAALAALLGELPYAYAATEQVIFPFGLSQGFGPGPLIFDAAGNLYGVAVGGGGNSQGLVFELSPSLGWTESVLHSFSGSDGARPIGALIFDSKGNLYGATQNGGGSGCGGSGCGVIFELSPSSAGWTETVLYTFTGGADGSFPVGGLVADSSGSLYGTAMFGGSANVGTIFRLWHTSASWKFSVLHSFTGSEGGEPDAGLVIGSPTILYGTASAGGKQSCSGLLTPGCGTVFKLTHVTSGWKFAVIHFFTGGNGGSNPASSLTLDQAGNLYGTALSGGASTYGLVFKLAPGSTGWKGTILHSFSGTDGSSPAAPLIFDKAGDLYGTTQFGGHIESGTSFGTAFELSPSASGTWSETVLHNFAAGYDGQYPSSGLILDEAGNLYGSTEAGGSAFSAGTVYEITP